MRYVQILALSLCVAVTGLNTYTSRKEAEYFHEAHIQDTNATLKTVVLENERIYSKQLVCVITRQSEEIETLQAEIERLTK